MINYTEKFYLISGKNRICREFFFIIIILLSGPGMIVCGSGQPDQLQQEFTTYISYGEPQLYSLDNLEKGDTITVTAIPTSGNLDPIIALALANTDFHAVKTVFQHEIQKADEGGNDIMKNFTDTLDRVFPAWDDDSGERYGSSLVYTIPESGNYLLIIMGNLFRTNNGYCRVIFELEKAMPGVYPISGYKPQIYRNTSIFREDEHLQIINSTLIAGESQAFFFINPVRKGESLYLTAYSEDNIPFKVSLNDFGGKALSSGEYRGGSQPVTLQYFFTKPAENYRIVINPINSSVTEKDIPFILVVGLNTPSVLSGDITERGSGILQLPTQVKIGFELDQITDINQKEENFAIVGNLWMQWTDLYRAFNPHECNCSYKIYRSIDEFVKAGDPVWPDFSIFNQQQRRWTQNTFIYVTSDGNVTYYERFWDILQAPDFDFKRYPFDIQDFYLRIDSLYPLDIFTFVGWPEKSRIGNQLGEEEWLITSSDTNTSQVFITDANSRFSFHVTVQRHIQYYILRILIPILIIILLTYISFLLSDYGKRADISSANLLILVAYNFMIGNDIPHVGYMTFLDIILGLSFIITGLTVIYNFYLKWVADAKTKLVAEKIDHIMVWLYPIIYLAGIGFLILSERIYSI